LTVGAGGNSGSPAQARHNACDKQLSPSSKDALCAGVHMTQDFLSLDRLPSNELSMTQELITNMLGVHREIVTEVR